MDTEKVEYAVYRAKCEGCRENGDAVRFCIDTNKKLNRGEILYIELNRKTEKVIVNSYKYQELNPICQSYPDYIEDIEFPNNIRRCKKQTL